MNYSKEARAFCEAIRTIASKPENLENLENYLNRHFSSWLEKFASTPGDLAGEMKEFAEMQIT